MTPSAAAQLQKGVASISPAPNPQTPKIRADQNMDAILDVQRIRISIERAMENEEDGTMQQVYKAMHGAIMQRLLGMDGHSVQAYLQQASGQPGGMMGGAPGPSPMPQPAAAMPGGPPQGGPPPGMSPMPGPPQG